MADKAIEHFERFAAGYEAERRRVLPGFDTFYGRAVAALALAGREIRSVLDLGSGTGLLAAHIASVYPQAQLTLLDGSPAMLDRARIVFGDRASYVVADLAEGLPDGDWDAIVSSLAIHHLDDAHKQSLYERVHDALHPGGMFVNAEQVAGATGLFDDAHQRWHEREARALGTTDAGWDHVVESMRHDRTATVERQLAWLRRSGFLDADCIWKDHRFAVIAARRAG